MRLRNEQVTNGSLYKPFATGKMSPMGGAQFTGRFPLSRGTRPPPFPRDTLSPASAGLFFYNRRMSAEPSPDPRKLSEFVRLVCDQQPRLLPRLQRQAAKP